MPSREAVESHSLTLIPWASWCHACVAGRGREALNFRHGGEETAAATPVVFSLGLVPRTGLVPYAVRGVCVFLQELGYTRMILKSDGEPSIAALVTAVQKEWAGDSKKFETQLIPRTSPVDDHASNGAAEGQWYRVLKVSRQRVKLLWRNLLEFRSRQIPRFFRGWCDITVFSETGLLCDRVAEHLLKS